MSERPAHERFAGLTYDDFRAMATDPSLTASERIGFPDELRAAADAAIHADLRHKLPALARRGARIADVGCGCGGLAERVVAAAAEQEQELVLVDAPEVLEHFAGRPGVRCVPGRFPAEADLAAMHGRCHAVLAYSVAQYAFAEANVFAFVDALCRLLAPGGRALVGDLPNASMRRRFLDSDAGRAHHRALTGRDEDPPVRFHALHDELDDAVVLGLVHRARDAGLHAWIVPQPPGLPMANRREDLLIERP